MPKTHGYVEFMWGGSDALAHNMRKATTQSLYQEAMIERDAYMAALKYDRHCRFKGRELVVHDKMSYQDDTERYEEFFYGEVWYVSFMGSETKTQVGDEVFEGAHYKDYKAFKELCKHLPDPPTQRSIRFLFPFCRIYSGLEYDFSCNSCKSTFVDIREVAAARAGSTTYPFVKLHLHEEFLAYDGDLFDHRSIPRGFHLSYGKFQDMLSRLDMGNAAFSVILASDICEEDKDRCSQLFKLSFPTELTEEEHLENFWKGTEDITSFHETYLVLGRIKHSNTRLGLEADGAVCVCVVKFNTRPIGMRENDKDFLDTAEVSAVATYLIWWALGMN